MRAVSSQINDSDSRLILISILLSLPLLASIVVGSALFFFSLSAVPTALLICYAAVYGLYFLKSRDVGPPLIALAFTLFSFLVASLFYDFSIDGRIHFQESVIQLAHGWNLFEAEIPVTSQWWGAEWCNYYPAGFQIIEASIYKLTDSIQAAKGCNFILLFSALAATLSVLRPLFGARRAVLAAVVLVLNPIVIAQLWTFYIDGALYSIFLTALCLLTHTSPGRYFNNGSVAENFQGRMLLALILASILILPTIKISALALSGFLYFLLVYQFKRRTGLMFGLSAAGIFLFGLVMYRPFFIYPLDRIISVVTLLTVSMPANIYDHVPVIGQLYNYFGTVTTIHDNNFIKLFSTDFSITFHSCAGLYGVIFGLVWIWSIIYLFRRLLKSRSVGGDNALPLYLFVITNLVPILFPSFMNQRFFPIQYIFPIAMLVHCYLDAGPKIKKIIMAVMAAMLINPMGYFADVIAQNIVYTSYVERSMNELAHRPPRPYLQVALDSRDLDSARLSWALSDRLLFKGLGIPVYMPVHTTSQLKMRERYERGRPLSVEPLVNDDGLMVIIQFDPAAAVDRPKIVKLSVVGQRDGKKNAEAVMYVQHDRAEAFGYGLDEYLRWYVPGGRQEIYLDIPPYANRVVIVGSPKVVFNKAELREADYPELITPKELTLKQRR